MSPRAASAARRRRAIVVVAIVVAGCVSGPSAAPSNSTGPTATPSAIATATPLAPPTGQQTTVVHRLGAIAWARSGGIWLIADGVVETSSDLGRSWTAIPLPAGRVPEALATSADAVLVVSGDAGVTGSLSPTGYVVHRRGLSDSSWHSTPIARLAGVSPALAADGNRAAVVLGAERHGPPVAVVVSSTDGGRSWSAPTSASDPLLAGPVALAGERVAADWVDPNGDMSMKAGVALGPLRGPWARGTMTVPAGFAASQLSNVAPLGADLTGAMLVAATYSADGATILEILRDADGRLVSTGSLSGPFPDTETVTLAGGVVLALGGGTLRSSSDAGRTWRRETTNLDPVVGVAFGSATVGLAEVQAQVGSFRLVLTTDGGVTWTPILEVTP